MQADAVYHFLKRVRNILLLGILPTLTDPFKNKDQGYQYAYVDDHNICVDVVVFVAFLFLHFYYLLNSI